MKRQKKIAVIAGNLREFNNFAKGNSKYIYVYSVERLYGLDLKGVIEIGTWYRRKDAEKIIEFAKSHIIKN